MASRIASGRRTQQERSTQTIARVLAAARELFATGGFAETSLEQIAAQAQVTTGALYHHFAGKRDIFLAVCEREQDRLTLAQSTAFRRKADPWDGFKAGCEAYLDAATDPGVQQIMLLDAPVVLGPDGLRRLEAESHAMAVEGVRRAMAAGRVVRRPPEPLVDLLFGALGAAAAAIAHSDDPTRALRAARRELRRVLDGLADG